MSDEKEMTTAQAAKLAKVKSADVLAFKDHGDTVVVVTTDGQKISASKKD